MAIAPEPVPDLGRLERVDPRLVWQHEAHSFTPWLLANGDRLADALGIEIEFTAREHPVGSFSLDLIGHDLTHDAVLIVENQLEPSDHSHLGQVLTYTAGTDAATIIWVAPRFRDEHRRALDWLNENTGEDIHFFGVEVEVVRIGDSVPAPLFNVIAQPNDWQKAAKAAVAASTGSKKALYVEFWGRYLEDLKAKHPGWSKARGAPSQNWFSMSSGIPGAQISASFAAKGRIRHELYIDRPTKDECEALFDLLFSQQVNFEQAYGRPLEWARLDSAKACRIAEYAQGDVAHVAEHDSYLRFFDDAGVRLRKALAAVATAPGATIST